MLYLQGMIIPGHPNNTGARPLLIGAPDQIDAQLSYFHQGNYGLTTIAEYEEVNDTEYAEELIRIKKYFAYGEFKTADELIDRFEIDDEKRELRDGIFFRRLNYNCYEISYKNESIEVDLNLPSGGEYEPSYTLDKIELEPAYFSIVHIGEGDGWDDKRPCMASIIRFDSKNYLTDAGPNILYTLECLGLNADSIDGVFFTHIHDDHFAGFYSLLDARSGNREKLKIFTTPSIFKTITNKLSALVECHGDGSPLPMHFEAVTIDQWYDLDGMQVLPILSPHPVDTVLFIFRAEGKDGFKTYGHFTDITCLTVAEGMVNDNKNEPGLYQFRLDKLKELYAMKLDLKKVDVDGPMVHGDSKDFVGDPSVRLVLSHTSTPLTPEQLTIGEQAQFGEVDILIKDKPT